VPLPARMLPHTLTIITPGSATDAYGNTVPDWDAATERDIAAYVRPQSTSVRAAGDEHVEVGRDVSERSWQAHINDTAVTVTDRARWNGDVYEVDGDPLRWVSAPGGRLSFTKVQLRRVDG
jgi:hypothetical protein